VVDEIRIGVDTLRLPFVIGLLGTALWVFTLVNVVNFMDGTNGLAMGSAAIGLLALAAIALERSSPAGAALAVCGAGALIGFLIWNYPSGRLFAGDAGALFAGAIAAFGSLIVVGRTGLSALVPPILFFPLLADGLLTLLFRVRRGRSLLTGHSEHIYQIAAGAGIRPIAPAYWIATALCGVAAYVVAQDENGGAPLLALAALSGLAVAVDILTRQLALRNGMLAP
jgi:Fuc2NAc and GlcNAc transferase